MLTASFPLYLLSFVKVVLKQFTAQILSISTLTIVGNALTTGLPMC